MESAVRYDFSFPPKSSSNSLAQNTNCGTNSMHSGNQLTHTIHNVRHHHDSKFNNNSSNSSNNVSLPKSASTSLLSCAAAAASSNNIINSSKSTTNNNNYCNNCNNCTKEMINNNNMMQNNLNMKSCLIAKSQQQHNVIKPSAMGLLQGQQINTVHHTPQTPKDSNCSFSKFNLILTFPLTLKLKLSLLSKAFDDLKNTLAFMEDSPLVKQIDNPVTNVPLMVNANTGNASETGALSSSSSISTSSSISCNSCCAPGYLPKSTSNPMLLSLATSSSSLTSGSSSGLAPSSPTSMTSSLAHQFNQNPVLELFNNNGTKKSPSDSEQTQYESYASSNTSLVTVASSMNNSINNSNGLLQQTGGINSAVETAAKKYRCAAQISEATCCWKGNYFHLTF